MARYSHRDERPFRLMTFVANFPYDIWTYADSNRDPPDCKTGALPRLELQALVFITTPLTYVVIGRNVPYSITPWTCSPESHEILSCLVLSYHLLEFLHLIPSNIPTSPSLIHVDISHRMHSGTIPTIHTIWLEYGVLVTGRTDAIQIGMISHDNSYTSSPHKGGTSHCTQGILYYGTAKP